MSMVDLNKILWGIRCSTCCTVCFIKVIIIPQISDYVCVIISGFKLKQYFRKHLNVKACHGGGGVICWVCFAASATGQSGFVDRTINSVLRNKILKQSVSQSAWGCFSAFPKDGQKETKRAAYHLVYLWNLYRKKKLWMRGFVRSTQSGDLKMKEILWLDPKRPHHAQEPSQAK